MMSVSRLQVRPAVYGAVKTQAIEDAALMQKTVQEECKRVGRDPPPYVLEELIGKGSFGRVYKGKDMKSAATVAVKIIDIDASDLADPRRSDAYSDFLKELGALKVLSESNAKNINHVIAALPVGRSMWMITEHCGGGSVATLMRPTAPKGLQSQWIIPILREVAEALKWVHQAQIIHRDVKCANVLITEAGGVQLCDFGIAGIVETKIDKRSTVIGTPNWMAPELFGATPSYGKEVDIWAFGAMAYEVATGLPPNAGVHIADLSSYLQGNSPRLEDASGDYPIGLCNLVAYCLEEDPTARPTIDQVVKHDYISNTSAAYPTTSLRALIGSFKIWESQGGNRKSLFYPNGAQNASSLQLPLDDEWNFSTTDNFDELVAGEFNASDVIKAYGPSVADFDEGTARPGRTLGKGSRRRPPPEAIGRLPAQPLEKIFDPNTMSNYDANSLAHYGRKGSQSDLPLRDDSESTSIRNSVVDLDFANDIETPLSSFQDEGTMKASSFNRSALSDPADQNPFRRTQDWKFPSALAPPASADPEVTHFPSSRNNVVSMSQTFVFPPPAAVTPGSGSRPTLTHHPTEPIGNFGGGLIQPPLDRPSSSFLIDLDMSMPEPTYEVQRPSTANSDAGPFELERHAPTFSSSFRPPREPSIYISDESEANTRGFNTLSLDAPIEELGATSSGAMPFQMNGDSQNRLGALNDDNYQNGGGDVVGLSEYQESMRRDISQRYNHDQGRYDEVPDYREPANRSMMQYSNTSDLDSDLRLQNGTGSVDFSRSANQSGDYTLNLGPVVPAQPGVNALIGNPTDNEQKEELNRVLIGLTNQMEAFRDVFQSSDFVGSNDRVPVQYAVPARYSSLRNSESMDASTATTGRFRPPDTVRNMQNGRATGPSGSA